jgi:hypothetical protein
MNGNEFAINRQLRSAGGGGVTARPALANPPCVLWHTCGLQFRLAQAARHASVAWRAGCTSCRVRPTLAEHDRADASRRSAP